MKILLDTHFILWSLKNDSHLPRAVREMIVDLSNTVYYSTASIWEVAIKHSARPDKMKIGGQELSILCYKAGYEMVVVDDRHIYALETLVFEKKTQEHKDPFDRILIAQAKSEGMTFLTHDTLLAGYHEKCVMVV